MTPFGRRNVDFALSDLDGDAQWLKTAASENMEKQAAERAAGIDRPGMTAEEMNTKGGDCEWGTWTQTPDEVEVTVTGPASGFKAKACSVKFARRKLDVKIAHAGGAAEGAVDLLLDPLFGEVNAGDCTWTKDGNNIVITLDKARQGEVWSGVV